MPTDDLRALKETYWDQGFVVVRSLFSEQEIKQAQKECDRLLSLDLIGPENGRTPFRFGATEFPERIDPVCDISPLFQSLIDDRRLRAIVAGLFDDEANLFKDKLILKGPGVAGYDMHQDWAWGWQDLCPADDVLSISIQIDGADAQNGGLICYADYHDQLLTPPGLATNFRAEELQRIDDQRAVPLETQPGDVVIFHALTPHRSDANTTDRWRRSLYLSMNAQRAGDLRTQYYQQYRSTAPSFI